MKFGFIGAAYQGRAKLLAAERCVNLFPEKAETGEAKAPLILLGTPGLSAPLYTLDSANGVRGLFVEPQTQRAFAVASNVFYELNTNNTATNKGALNDPPGVADKPVTMRSNGSQLVLSSGGLGYVFNLTSGAFQQINGVNFPFRNSNVPGASGFPGANQFEFFDTYLLALDPTPNSRKVYISLVTDATDWGALNFLSKDGYPDNLVAMVMNRRELQLMGSQRGEKWWDAGNSGGVPFEREQGSTIETGCVAASTLLRCDSGVFWLGGNEYGQGIAYRSTDQSSAERISTHAVEFQWSQYGAISDAEAFVELHGGHTFYVLNFPTGDATWVYDCATGLWHQRCWMDPDTGQLHRHLGRNHIFWNGKHLVGDRLSGNIYQSSLSTYQDNGNAIKRVRSCSVFQERKWINYHKLAVYMDEGDFDGVQGAGQEPLAYLRISDNGGRTWGNPIEMPIGHQGEYGFGSIWRNLGRSLDRVFEWSTSEPIPISLIEAYLE